MTLKHPQISRDSYAKMIDGIILDAGKHAEKAKKDADLAKKTAVLAARLFESGDTGVYRPVESWLHMVPLVGDPSVIESSKYANRNILPVVMKANARAYLGVLTRYLEACPYARMMVITSGERVLINFLEDAIDALIVDVRTKLRVLLCKKYSCVSIFSRIEITIKFDPELNAYTYHPHIHMLYEPKKALGGEKFGEMLSKARAAVKGRHIHDCGRLVNPAEACKYVCKIDSDDASVGILDLPVAELRMFASVLYRSKLLNPLDGFKKFVARLNRENLRLVRIRTKQGYRWVEVTKSEGRDVEVTYDGIRDTGDIVYGWCMGAFTSNVIRKHLIVGNFSGDKAKLFAKRNITEDTFAVGWADSSNVHTNTPNVQSSEDGPMSLEEIDAILDAAMPKPG